MWLHIKLQFVLLNQGLYIQINGLPLVTFPFYVFKFFPFLCCCCCCCLTGLYRLQEVYLQGVPKVHSSTLLVCISVGLDLVSKSCVFQSNSLFLYSLCHLLTRIFDLCASLPKVRVREYIFQPHNFCILQPELLELLLDFCEYHER